MKISRRQMIGAVIACFVVFGGGVLAYRALRPSVVSQAEMHATWVMGVRTILSVYDADHDSARARDAMLALRVIREDQSAHLALVLAFQRIMDHQERGLTALTDARRAFDARSSN